MKRETAFRVTSPEEIEWRTEEVDVTLTEKEAESDNKILSSLMVGLWVYFPPDSTISPTQLTSPYPKNISLSLTTQVFPLITNRILACPSIHMTESPTFPRALEMRVRVELNEVAEIMKKELGMSWAPCN